MTDLNEIMKQAKQMQEQFKKAQEEQLKTRTEGESGAGLVKVVMNGKHDVLSVSLDDSLMSEEKAVVEDLLAAFRRRGGRVEYQGVVPSHAASSSHC